MRGDNLSPERPQPEDSLFVRTLLRDTNNLKPLSFQDPLKHYSQGPIITWDHHTVRLAWNTVSGLV